MKKKQKNKQTNKQRQKRTRGDRSYSENERKKLPMHNVLKFIESGLIKSATSITIKCF